VALLDWCLAAELVTSGTLSDVWRCVWLTTAGWLRLTACEGGGVDPPLFFLDRLRTDIICQKSSLDTDKTTVHRIDVGIQ
jgi:hypothetical protein